MKALRPTECRKQTTEGEVLAPIGPLLTVSRKNSHKLRTLCCLTVVGLAALLHAPASNGGECLSSDREVKGMAASSGDGKQVLPTRSFVCEVDEETDVRIEFYRLNDVIVGDLLEGRESSVAKQVLGQFSIHNNAVYDEVKTLFDRFGVHETSSLGWSARIDSGEWHESFESNDQDVKDYTFLTGIMGLSSDFAFPEGMREARSGRDWYRDFHFFTQIVPRGLPIDGRISIA